MLLNKCPLVMYKVTLKRSYIFDDKHFRFLKLTFSSRQKGLVAGKEHNIVMSNHNRRLEI